MQQERRREVEYEEGPNITHGKKHFLNGKTTENRVPKKKIVQTLSPRTVYYLLTHPKCGCMAPGSAVCGVVLKVDTCLLFGRTCFEERRTTKESRFTARVVVGTSRSL